MQHLLSQPGRRRCHLQCGSIQILNPLQHLLLVLFHQLAFLLEHLLHYLHSVCLLLAAPRHCSKPRLLLLSARVDHAWARVPRSL